MCYFLSDFVFLVIKMVYVLLYIGIGVAQHFQFGFKIGQPFRKCVQRMLNLVDLVSQLVNLLNVNPNSFMT